MEKRKMRPDDYSLDPDVDHDSKKGSVQDSFSIVDNETSEIIFAKTHFGIQSIDTKKTQIVVLCKLSFTPDSINLTAWFDYDNDDHYSLYYYDENEVLERIVTYINTFNITVEHIIFGIDSPTQIVTGHSAFHQDFFPRSLNKSINTVLHTALGTETPCHYSSIKYLSDCVSTTVKISSNDIIRVNVCQGDVVLFKNVGDVFHSTPYITTNTVQLRPWHLNFRVTEHDDKDFGNKTISRTIGNDMVKDASKPNADGTTKKRQLNRSRIYYLTPDQFEYIKEEFNSVNNVHSYNGPILPSKIVRKYTLSQYLADTSARRNIEIGGNVNKKSKTKLKNKKTKTKLKNKTKKQKK